jgi:predicted 2-oxoglutarate/Fe(II)-dependent dioxygenase YbiX
MNNPVEVIENFLSKDECNFILKRCKEELDLFTAIVNSGNPNVRKSSIAWIDDLGDVNERLKNILKSRFNFEGAEVTGLESFQFTEYKVGEFYEWHTDRNSTIDRKRFVSTVIQLNDDYGGGLLEIKDRMGNLIPINQKLGNLYIFDSGLVHRVTPVNVNARYSLVNWVSLVKTNVKKQNII